MPETSMWLVFVIILATAMDVVFVWAWREAKRRGISITQLQRNAPRLTTLTNAIAQNPLLAAIPLVFAIGYLSQFAFNMGRVGENAGIVLFLLVFPATWLFAYLENNQLARQSHEQIGDASPPDAGPVVRQLYIQPWRTFTATLSIMATVSAASLRVEPENNTAVIFLWLAGIGLFISACTPAKVSHDVGQWREAFRRHWPELLAVFAILAAGATARLTRLDHYPIGMEQDEGALGTDALRIMAGNGPYFFSVTSFAEHPAGFVYLQAASMAVFGKTEVGLRIPSAVVGSLTVLFVYLLARRMFGSSMGLIASALFALAPYHVYYSRTGTFDMVGIQLPLVAMLYFVYQGHSSRRAYNYGLAGICFGLGLWVMYNNISMILIPLAAIIFLYLSLTQRDYLRTAYARIGLFLVGMLVVMLPVWSTFAKANRLWVEPSRGRFILSEYNFAPAADFYGTTSVVVVMANQVKRSIFSFNYFGDSSHLAVAGRRPVLDDLTAIFFFIGLAYSIWHWKDPRYGILLLAFGATLQVSIWSGNPVPPQAHRLAPAVVCAYLLAAIGLHKSVTSWANQLGWPSIFSGLTIAALLAQISYVGIGATFSPKNFPVEWLAPTTAGKVIRDWIPNYRVYFVGAPFAYPSQHKTITFNSELKSEQAISVENVREIVPLQENTDRDVAFIFLAPYFEDVNFVQKVYPGSQLIEWRDEYQHRVYLKALVISQREINGVITSP